jgi:hypothetical protein
MVFAVTCPIAVGAAASIKIFLSVISDEFRAYRDQLRSDLTLIGVTRAGGK